MPQKHVVFFLSSFDDAKILSNLGVALKIQQMFILVRFVPFFFSAEPSL